MYRSTILFLCVFLLLIGQATANGISLQFEARYACAHTPIDSILVENLSRQTSVVLYYPDTVIDSAPVSVVTLPGNGNTLHVSRNYPNPFTGRTSVDVFVPQADMVSLRVFDISGRLLASYESQLQPGMHHFEFHSSDRQHYLLSVSSNRFHEQRLMIQLGRGSRHQPELVYSGMGAQMMSGQDAEFYFQSGDDMRFTAYVTAPGGEVVIDTRVDTPVANAVYLFEMAEEVPAQPSEIQGPSIVSAQAAGLEYEVDHVPGVHYEWTLPQGWEIISGAGESQITVNAGNQAGTLTVVASNDCGSSAERTFDVEMSYLLTLAVNSDFEGQASGEGTFAFNESVTATASPEAGFSFLYWEDEAGTQVSTDAVYTFSMPAEDLTLTAIFGVMDTDGNTYGYTTIDGRQWLSENLRTSVYKDGTPIARLQDAEQWSAATTGAYAVLPHGYLEGLDSDADVVAAYGKLYNYRVVQDDRGVCPAGWSIASHYNYLGLFEYLELEYGLTLDAYFTKDDEPGHSKNAGHALSSCRQVNAPLGGDCATTQHPRWSPAVDGVYGWDQFGFTALPAGVRNNDGYFISAMLKKSDQLAKMSPAKDYFDENYMDIAAFWAAGKVTLIGFTSYLSFFDHYPEDDGWFDAAFASGAALRCIRDKDSYSLQLALDPLDGGVLAGAGDYTLDQQVSITAEAAPGFTFVHWQNGLGHVISTEAAWSFEMPNHDMSLKAVFEAVISNTVTVEAASALEGSVSGGGQYSPGEDVTVTASPESGFSFLYWEDGAGTQLSTHAVYTFSMPDEDVSLTAFFGVVDAGGNTYGYTTINGRQWLSENLRTTKYNDGSDIPSLVDDMAWEETTQGAYAILPHDMVTGIDSDIQVVDAFGKLYNHYAVTDSRGLCPAGWSVPPPADYQALLDYLINEHGYLPGFVYDPYKANYLPNALRSCRQTDSPLGEGCTTDEQPRWYADSVSYSSDPFGWSGLPGGARRPFGEFDTTLGKSSLQIPEFDAHAAKSDELIVGLFWTTSPESILILTSFWAHLLSPEDGLDPESNMGISVRCIRNLP